MITGNNGVRDLEAAGTLLPLSWVLHGRVREKVGKAASSFPNGEKGQFLVQVHVSEVSRGARFIVGLAEPSMHGHEELCASMCPLIMVQHVSRQEAWLDFVDHVLEVHNEGRLIVAPFTSRREVGVGEGVINVEVIVSLDEVFKQHWLKNIRFEAGSGEGWVVGVVRHVVDVAFFRRCVGVGEVVDSCRQSRCILKQRTISKLAANLCGRANWQ